MKTRARMTLTTAAAALCAVAVAAAGGCGGSTVSHKSPGAGDGFESGAAVAHREFRPLTGRAEKRDAIAAGGKQHAAMRGKERRVRSKIAGQRRGSGDDQTFLARKRGRVDLIGRVHATPGGGSRQ